MKKLVYVVAILTAMVFITACENKSSVSDISSEVVEQQLGTFAEAEAILKRIIKNGCYINEDVIKDIFKPKGYIVVADDDNRSYYCMKNCELKKEGDQGQYISFTTINQDSLASAICFTDQYAGGVFAEFYLFDDEVYNLIIEQAKKRGYKKELELSSEEKKIYLESGYANDSALYNGRYYFECDKNIKHLTLRSLSVLPDLPEKIVDYRPDLSKTLTCSNFLNLLNNIENERYAEICGLKKIYKNVDEDGAVTYVYGIDVEKVKKDSLLAKSDHACYIDYYESGGPVWISLNFKDRLDADDFFESAISYGLIYTGRGTLLLKVKKTGNLNFEELYMDKKVRFKDGWYVINIDDGGAGD